MLRTTMLFLVVALAATAQTPASRQPNWCGFTGPNGGIPKADVLEPSEFAVPGGDLCGHYTFDAGWEETMVLQLGEGAEEYREWIEMAVRVWNDALSDNSFGPVLEISNKRPRNHRIARSFWEDYEAGDEPTLDQEDDENVIYFKPSSEWSAPLGVARTWTWSFSNEMAEADIYINTRREEEEGFPVAETAKLLGYSHDGKYGIWLYAHSAYLTILHELGHALGLDHIPVAGNIMSYSPSEGLRQQWEAPMAMHMHMLHRYSGIEKIGNDFFVDHEDFNRIGNTRYIGWLPITNDRARILTNFYTSKVRLGAVEKMLLACSYEF